MNGEKWGREVCNRCAHEKVLLQSEWHFLPPPFFDLNVACNAAFYFLSSEKQFAVCFHNHQSVSVTKSTLEATHVVSQLEEGMECGMLHGAQGHVLGT